MLIKAKPTKKMRAAFITHDATDQEIAEFVSFLNADTGRAQSPRDASTGGNTGTGGTRAPGRKGGGKGRPQRT